jgi:glucan 1,3-beta-glucosidase
MKTERDFAEIASAGLNWIRLPIAHWAIETWPEEPYLERVSWKYVLKAIQWARKYGIRIQLDLHTVSKSSDVVQGTLSVGVSHRAVHPVHLTNLA